MAEIQTADGANGVTTLSDQSEPTPKSGNDDAKESGTNEPKPKGRKGSSITTKIVEDTGPKLGHQGRVESQWDNPAADPNLRKHIGEAPDGEGNEISDVE